MSDIEIFSKIFEKIHELIIELKIKVEKQQEQIDSLKKRLYMLSDDGK